MYITDDWYLFVERIGEGESVDPFAVYKISASYKNQVIVNLDYDSVTGLIVDDFGRAGETDAVDTVVGVKVVCPDGVVSMTVDVKQIIVLVENICESIRIFISYGVNGMMVENKYGSIGGIRFVEYVFKPLCLFVAHYKIVDTKVLRSEENHITAVYDFEIVRVFDFAVEI